MLKEWVTMTQLLVQLINLKVQRGS